MKKIESKFKFENLIIWQLAMELGENINQYKYFLYFQNLNLKIEQYFMKLIIENLQTKQTIS